MIEILATYEGQFKQPMRPLTEEELARTDGFKVYSDANRYVYFESDEEYDLFVQENTTLAERKNARIIEIDAKTQEIISRGFVFDTKTFSLSARAQDSWNQFGTALCLGVITENMFPFEISDKNDQKYLLAWSDRLNFLGMIVSVIATAKRSGTNFKQQILDAQTKEEIDLIIDNR